MTEILTHGCLHAFIFMSIFRINLASVVLKLWYSESVGGRFFLYYDSET